MNNPEYSLVEPFDIDNGELDGIRPQVVFCLGVEWQMVSAQLETGEEIVRTIHAENASRIKRMCIRKGRRFKVEPAGNEWNYLTVEALI